MAQPFVGEIRILPFLRGAPTGWQLCDGSLLSISQYNVLYALLGTTYGGDGVNTFGVPDLRGRAPVHQGTGTGLSPYVLGQKGGQETVTLTAQQMGPHTHPVMASTANATATAPTNAVTATIVGDLFYTTALTGPTGFPPNTVQTVGGNQPHDNMAPTLTLRFCIAWAGIYPQQQ